jgi:hypothetical protein
MDITNNTSSFTTYTGGNIDSDISLSESDIISKKKSDITETELTTILDKINIDIGKNKFNISELNKNPTFNKLNNNQKTILINKILDNEPKSNKKIDTSLIKECYLFCKNCGYSEKIPPKMFIFSRGDHNSEDNTNYNFLNYVNDNTLPFTKNYNCINDKCLTHTQIDIKKAVFYRFNNTYNIKYICTICNNHWNTFNESIN